MSAVTLCRSDANPDDIKVLFLVYPILAETDEEAQAKRQRMVSSPHFIERALASTATVTDIDFSKYDLDQPLPRLTTNGEQGSLDKFAQWGSGKTLRQLAMERFGAPDSEGGFRRCARHGGRPHGERHGGDRRRRLPHQHAIPAHQPPADRGGNGGFGSGVATARSDANGISGANPAGCAHRVPDGKFCAIALITPCAAEIQGKLARWCRLGRQLRLACRLLLSYDGRRESLATRKGSWRTKCLVLRAASRSDEAP